MYSNQTTLLVILRDVISFYEKIVDENTIINNSYIIKNNDKLISLATDVYVIKDFSILELKKMCSELQIEDDMKNKILEYLKIIKTLLELNDRKKTTYKLSDEQLQYLNMFLTEANNFILHYSKTTIYTKEELSDINVRLSSYKDLLSIIENPDEPKFITDINTVKQLFNECDIDEYTKRSILLDIMRTNQNIFNYLKAS